MSENLEQEPDYVYEYSAQIKRYKKAVYAMLILIGLGLLSPFVLLATGYEKYFIDYILYFLLAPFILSFIIIWKMKKCPKCGKYIGKLLFENCPHCQVKLK